ncbi:MAG: hypothetical protein J0I12_19445 [Candidatus Eremiobacteraeota bacterium]|nr:hypothetical protein [Candidatus Eremiobacteraeota bacterium]
MDDPKDSALIQKLSFISGLEIVPTEMGRLDIVSELVRPMLNRLVAQVSAEPGSLWVPDSTTLWEGLPQERRLNLMRHSLQQVKLNMTPVAQRFRCYPAGLSLQVTMDNWENEAVLDEICEITGWDVRPALVLPEEFPSSCRFEQAPRWEDLLSDEDYRHLLPLLRSQNIEPFEMSILLAMADPSDWRTRQEVSEITGLSVQPFQAEEEEIAAALREKVGGAEEDLWRQMAILPTFFRLDRLLPVLTQFEVLPQKLLLRVGMSNVKDPLALHQIRLLTGYEIEPVEMTGQAIVTILERMLRQAR